MIAADTSTLIACFAGEASEDVSLVKGAITQRSFVLAPPVLSEILSDPMLPEHITDAMLSLPLMPTKDGYWARVGRMRAAILKQKKKARLPDALIAQYCIDHDTPLITRDKDFRHFADNHGLVLLPALH